MPLPRRSKKRMPKRYEDVITLCRLAKAEIDCATSTPTAEKEGNASASFGVSWFPRFMMCGV